MHIPLIYSQGIVSVFNYREQIVKPVQKFGLFFSAETNASFNRAYPWVKNFCNAQPGNPWDSFLGSYLMANPSNGLEKIDDAYFTDYAAAFNSNTACPSCSCTFTNGNNLDLQNIMWFTYTLLADPYATYHSGIWLSRTRSIDVPLQYYFNSIEIYPNPVKDHIQINYSIDEAESKAIFVMYSIDGRTVFETSLNTANSSLAIDRNNINPGLYFCKFIVNNSLIDIKSIILE